MANLRMPSSCSECSGNKFKHLFKPERWACKACDHIEAERPMRDSSQCRECNAPRGSKEFDKTKNLCLECKSDLHKAYRDQNKEQLKEYRDRYWAERGPEERRRRVKESEERSAESFLRTMVTSVKKKAKYRGKATRGAFKGDSRFIREDHPIYDVNIDFDYMWELYQKQNGKCALSGVELKHVFGDLRTMSIDRIDSSKGYVRGNVQILAQSVNLSKGKHSNKEVLEFLAETWKTRFDVIDSLRATGLFEEGWILEHFTPFGCGEIELVDDYD